MMFNNNKKSDSAAMNNSNNASLKADDNLSSVNMVSEGTEIIGTLKTKSDIRIAGKVDGEAKVEGKIIIASTGHLDGNVDSKDADVAGRVEGEVHVSSKLTLRQSAVVEGDLYAQSLVVEEGATFNGACHMREYSTAEKSKIEKENTTNKDSDDETVAA